MNRATYEQRGSTRRPAHCASARAARTSASAMPRPRSSGGTKVCVKIIRLPARVYSATARWPSTVVSKLLAAALCTTDGDGSGAGIGGGDVHSQCPPHRRRRQRDSGVSTGFAGCLREATPASRRAPWVGRSTTDPRGREPAGCPPAPRATTADSRTAGANAGRHPVAQNHVAYVSKFGAPKL